MYGDVIVFSPDYIKYGSVFCFGQACFPCRCIGRNSIWRESLLPLVGGGHCVWSLIFFWPVYCIFPFVISIYTYILLSTNLLQSNLVSKYLG